MTDEQLDEELDWWEMDARYGKRVVNPDTRIEALVQVVRRLRGERDEARRQLNRRERAPKEKPPA